MSADAFGGQQLAVLIPCYNVYGFMDFSSVPGGEDFKTAPCNGLLDQAMALRWVHENIAAFGGDKREDETTWTPRSSATTAPSSARRPTS